MCTQTSVKTYPDRSKSLSVATDFSLVLGKDRFHPSLATRPIYRADVNNWFHPIDVEPIKAISGEPRR